MFLHEMKSSMQLINRNFQYKVVFFCLVTNRSDTDKRTHRVCVCNPNCFFWWHKLSFTVRIVFCELIHLFWYYLYFLDIFFLAQRLCENGRRWIRNSCCFVVHHNAIKIHSKYCKHKKLFAAIFMRMISISHFPFKLCLMLIDINSIGNKMPHLNFFLFHSFNRDNATFTHIVNKNVQSKLVLKVHFGKKNSTQRFSIFYIYFHGICLALIFSFIFILFFLNWQFDLIICAITITTLYI